MASANIEMPNQIHHSTCLPTPARRQSKRKSASTHDSPVPAPTPKITHASACTPSKRRSKRVRFSDSDVPTSTTTNNATGSTSLTPAVRRASLGSTPLRHPMMASSPVTGSGFPATGTIQFTPFREVLDGRFLRRLRRNGLSEEMNDYEVEKKTRTQLERVIEEKNAELNKLRQELKLQTEKGDAATAEAQAELCCSQKSVQEVEAELEVLQMSFSEHTAAYDVDGEEVDWDHVARSVGPGSEGGDTIRIYEDEGDGLNLASPSMKRKEARGAHRGLDTDLVAMAVDLESARSEKTRLFQESRNRPSNPATDLHFADSPLRRAVSSNREPPKPPQELYLHLSRSFKAATQRAEEAELTLHSLETEVKALGVDASANNASSMVANLATQLRTARLELERIMPGETATGFNNAKILPEIIAKLKQLVRQVGDRDAELKSLRDQQRSLKGNFEHALIAAENANAKVKDLEDVIDRGAEEMLDIRMKSQALEKECGEKDRTITKLIDALEKYRSDLTRVEQLVVKLESEQAFKILEAKDETAASFEEKVSDLDAQVAAEVTGRRAAESSAVERLVKIQELEAALDTARHQATEFSAQLTSLSEEKDQVEVKLSSQLATEKSEHEQQLGSLNTRISSLSTALASSNAEIDKLNIIKSKLEERVQEEVDAAATATEAMMAQQIKAVTRSNEQYKKLKRGAKVRSANWELQHSEDDMSSERSGGPMTPVSVVRFADVDLYKPEDFDEGEGDGSSEHIEGNVEIVRGSKGKGRAGRRRRYDSGVGMESLSEEGEEEEYDEMMMPMTPELTSDMDIEMEA